MLPNLILMHTRLVFGQTSLSHYFRYSVTYDEPSEKFTISVFTSYLCRQVYEKNIMPGARIFMYLIYVLFAVYIAVLYITITFPVLNICKASLSTRYSSPWASMRSILFSRTATGTSSGISVTFSNKLCKQYNRYVKNF